MQPKYGSTSLCDQNCGVQSADTQTAHRQHTDRHRVKTEGPWSCQMISFTLRLWWSLTVQ